MIKMKYILSLLCVATVVLSSCGDGKGNSVLIGSWDAVLLQANGTQTLTDDAGEVTTCDYILTSGAMAYVITFSEGSYVLAGAYDITNEQTKNGVKEFTNVSYSNASGSGQYDADDTSLAAASPFWALEVNGINITAEAGEQTHTIDELTDGELTLSSTINNTVTDGSGTYNHTTNLTTQWRKR